ncbi:MAG: hypothetical protein IKS28_07960 [Clostridia bacterium]|jgi:hypothetical protein|nr:hypothetical protein [Clostridia bacterium]
MKQTRFTIGLMLLIQAASYAFLAICYLFSDKKRTAAPFTLLGFFAGIGGMMLVSEQLREKLDRNDILSAMDDFCEDGRPAGNEIPIDETAGEEEFS